MTQSNQAFGGLIIILRYTMSHTYPSHLGPIDSLMVLLLVLRTKFPAWYLYNLFSHCSLAHAPVPGHSDTRAPKTRCIFTPLSTLPPHFHMPCSFFLELPQPHASFLLVWTCQCSTLCLDVSSSRKPSLIMKELRPSRWDANTAAVLTSCGILDTFYNLCLYFCSCKMGNTVPVHMPVL